QDCSVGEIVIRRSDDRFADTDEAQGDAPRVHVRAVVVTVHGDLIFDILSRLEAHPAGDLDTVIVVAGHQLQRGQGRAGVGPQQRVEIAAIRGDNDVSVRWRGPTPPNRFAPVISPMARFAGLSSRAGARSVY